MYKEQMVPQRPLVQRRQVPQKLESHQLLRNITGLSDAAMHFMYLGNLHDLASGAKGPGSGEFTTAQDFFFPPPYGCHHYAATRKLVAPRG